MIHIALTVLLALLSQVAPPPQGFTPRSQEGGCVYDFGTVGIAGDSRSTPGLPTTNWPNAMAGLLQAHRGDIINLALGASVATGDVEAGWDIERTGPWQVQELINAQVDMIVIAFGVNDINNMGNSAVQVYADLGVLVGMCQSANIPFVVATIEYMFPPHQVFNNPTVLELNSLLQASGWPLYDFANATNGSQYTDDGLHTNALGMRVKSRLAADSFCILDD